jgi:hypothetical protein
MHSEEDGDMVKLSEGKLCIDGVLRRAAGGKVYDDISPWTGEVIGQAADASPEDVNEQWYRPRMGPRGHRGIYRSQGIGIAVAG